jgi:hypothetical protein
VYPEANETCDGRDTDCNRLVDDSPDCIGSCENPGKLGRDEQVSIGPKFGVISSLVWSGLEFAVAYNVLDPTSTGEIRYRRLRPNGSPAAPEVLVSASNPPPCGSSMVWTGSEYGLAWIDSCAAPAGTAFARLDAAGKKIGSDVQVGAPFSAYALSAAWNGHDYGIAWRDYRSPVSGIFFARLDRQGVKQGVELRVTDNGANPRIPSLVWTGTEYAVAWDDHATGREGIYLARFTASGTKIGSDIQISTGGILLDPSLVWMGTGFGLAWWGVRDGNSEIYFARLDASGHKIGEDVRVTNDAADSFSPSLAWTGQEFGISWDDRRENREIFFARLDALGRKLGGDVRITHQAAESWLSHLVWTGQEYGVSWSDLRESFPPAYENVYFSRIGCHLENEPPVADAGRDLIAECTSPQGAVVSLDGSASYDPVGQIRSFEWYSDFGSSTQTHLGSGPRPELALSLGTHEITLVVTNDSGTEATDTVLVMVSDTTPPTLPPAELTRTMLWPPNHRMVEVQVTASAVDTCTGATISLEYVTSSEPDDETGMGDGNTSNDIQGADIGTADFDFLLRAERTEPGAGRIYGISYLATDGAGNKASQFATIVVPDHWNGSSDPVFVSMTQDHSLSQVNWSDVPGALSYNVVQGLVENLTETRDTIWLGPLVCLASDFPPGGVGQVEDASTPELGTALFYLAEYTDTLPSSYGSPSASKPAIGEGGCP